MASGVELAAAYITLIPTTKGMRREIAGELAQVEGDAKKTGDRAGKKMSGGFTGAFAGIGKRVIAPLGAAMAGLSVGQFFADAIRGASDLEQSVGGVEAVFKSQAGAIKTAAAEAAQNLGLSKNAYQELATVLGAGLKNQGIKDYARSTQDLIGIGADLAAQYGGSTKDAVDALASAMRGESDPIERYGISLNETAVNAELAARGQDKLKGAALQQAKAQARIAIITRQSADATGAFARESDTLAGKQARMAASWENFKTTIGTALLPVMSALLDVMSGLGGRITGLFQSMGGGQGVMDRLRSGVDAVKAGFSALAQSPVGRWFADLAKSVAGTLVPAVGEVSGIIRTQFLPSLAPIGGALLGAAKAFASFAAAIINSPIGQFLTFLLKGVILGFVQGVKDLFTGLVKVVSGAFQAIAGLITGDWSRVWDGLKTVVAGAIQGLWGLLNVGLMGRVLGVFRGFGQVLAQVFVGSGPIGSALRAFGSFALGVLTGIGKGFVEFGGTLGRIAGSVIGPAIRAVGAVFGTLKGLADNAIGAVVRVFTDLGGKIKGALVGSGDEMTRFGKVVSSVWNAVVGAITGAWNRIFGGVLTPMRATIAGVILAAWNGFQTTVGNVWSAVTGFTSRAWSAILAVFNLLRSWLASNLTATFNAWRATAAAVWSAVTSTISTAWNSILSRVFTPLRTWVASTLTGAFNAFRSLAAAVWSAITSTISSAWSTILSRVFTPLRTWIVSTLTSAFTAWRSLVAAVWSAISSAISSAWSTILSRVFTPLRQWVTSTLPSAFNSWRSTVASVWSAITSSVSTAWNSILSRVFTPLRTWATSTLTSAMRTLQSVASSVWSAVTSTIASAWSRISGSFTNLKNGVNQVWSFFQAAVRGIGSAWSGLTGAISGPINSAKSWINNNLVGRMNSMLGTVGVSFRVPAMSSGGVWLGPGVTKAARGTVLPGYTPGRDVHKFYSPTGGRLHLSGGEAIMVPEWARALGPQLIQAMNAIARRGGVSAIRRFLFGSPNAPTAGSVTRRNRAPYEYANGGVWRPQRFADGGILDALMDPVAAIKGLASSALNAMPASGFAGNVVKGFGQRLITGVADKVKSVWSSLMGGAVGAGGGGSVMGWQRQWAWARANLPGVRLHSGFRPGARTRAGKNVSYHALGRAIDITPNMGMFNKIKATFFKNIRELIFSPANSMQVNNGRNWYYSSPITRADHWDHIHWAMRRGGVLDGLKLYDRGGMLRRGDIAVHDAAKPDRVLTDAQWKAVMRHLPLPEQPSTVAAGIASGVHIHGDVYGDPERFARKYTTRLRDELALTQLAGV